MDRARAFFSQATATATGSPKRCNSSRSSKNNKKLGFSTSTSSRDSDSETDCDSGSLLAAEATRRARSQTSRSQTRDVPTSMIPSVCRKSAPAGTVPESRSRRGPTAALPKPKMGTTTLRSLARSSIASSVSLSLHSNSNTSTPESKQTSSTNTNKSAGLLSPRSKSLRSLGRRSNAFAQSSTHTETSASTSTSTNHQNGSTPERCRSQRAVTISSPAVTAKQPAARHVAPLGGWTRNAEPPATAVTNPSGRKRARLTPVEDASHAAVSKRRHPATTTQSNASAWSPGTMAARQQPLPPSTTSTVTTALNTTWEQDNEEQDDSDDDSDCIRVWSGTENAPASPPRRASRSRSQNKWTVVTDHPTPPPVDAYFTETAASAAVTGVKKAPLSNTVRRERLEAPLQRKCCWKCAVDLELPDGTFCCYAVHAHAVLNVPVCAACADEVADATEDPSNSCAGCAKTADQAQGDEEDLVLFCCDAPDTDCGRVFCKECVAQAYGAANGQARAQALQDDDDETPWLCLACQPPPTLRQLQLSLEKGATYNAVPRNLDDVLVELTTVESAKQECEEISTLEKDEEKRREIEEELSGCLSGGDLEEAVEEELTEWKQVLYKHDLRLSDTIGSLQDELQTVHNLDLVDLYEKLGLHHRRPVGSEPERRPDWALEADRELDQRSKHGLWAPDPCHPSVYKTSIPTDVEDLDTPKEGIEYANASNESGWHHNLTGKPSEEDIEEALEYEAQEFGLVKPPVISENQDMEEMLAEERQASGTSGNGVRVRRDAYKRVRHAPLNQRRRAVVRQPKVAAREQQEPGLVERPREIMVSDLPRDPSSPDVSQSPSSALKEFAPLTRMLVSSPNSLSDLPRDPSSPDVSQPPSSALKEFAPSTRILVSSPNSPDEGNIFGRSSLVLCSASLKGTKTPTIRTVTVAKPLVKILKPHQVDGLKFIWQNAFSDFAHCASGDHSKVGGCIIAHNMGLGKSLTSIALLHTVLHHPSMVSTITRRPLLKTVLLVVPVNTVANWENEFRRWISDDLDPYYIRLSNLTEVKQWGRSESIRTWKQEGGVLLLSEGLFKTLMKDTTYSESLQPDILVLDEAHTCLSKTSNQSYKALSRIRTPRKIALTGSPVQNNLLEYFRMVNWIRPNLFHPMTESDFDKTFVLPIMNGMASDAPLAAVYNSMVQSNLLNERLMPHVQRKDASELMKELPPMQQVVLHVRQSRMQCSLFRYYQRLQKSDSIHKNFLKMYTTLRPITNHPGTLFLSSSDKTPKADGPTNSSDRDSGDEWWMGLFKKINPETLKELENGSKIILLLNILVLSEQIGDKVLVFSQCLKTLNFIEEVLGYDDWSQHASSLKLAFPGKKMGSWEKGRDYLRIDGDVGGGERGGLIDQFNNSKKKASKVKALLISSKAGGMGINLPTANRVVLFDSHFNPTVMTQAVFRAYRYGQAKEVFVYRLLTEGSIEEKVYSHSVNKTGVALRVIDKKSITRSFTEQELQSMQESYNWVQCDKCEKWRMLAFDVTEEELPDTWFCSMNATDRTNNTCDAPERNQIWYEKQLSNAYSGNNESPIKCMAREFTDAPPSHGSKQKLVANDKVLEHLLKVTEREKKTTVVSRFYFHEALLESKDNSAEEMETAREAMEAEGKTLNSPIPAATMEAEGKTLNSSVPAATVVVNAHPTKSTTTAPTANSSVPAATVVVNAHPTKSTTTAPTANFSVPAATVVASAHPTKSTTTAPTANSPASAAVNAHPTKSTTTSPTTNSPASAAVDAHPAKLKATALKSPVSIRPKGSLETSKRSPLSKHDGTSDSPSKLTPSSLRQHSNHGSKIGLTKLGASRPDPVETLKQAATTQSKRAHNSPTKHVGSTPSKRKKRLRPEKNTSPATSKNGSSLKRKGGPKGGKSLASSTAEVTATDNVTPSRKRGTRSSPSRGSGATQRYRQRTIESSLNTVKEKDAPSGDSKKTGSSFRSRVKHAPRSSPAASAVVQESPRLKKADKQKESKAKAQLPSKAKTPSKGEVVDLTLSDDE